MRITIPFKPEPKVFFQDDIGNAGNGGRPNPPTIPNQQPGTFPRVNPYAKFRIGAYNNDSNEYEKYNPVLHSNTFPQRNYYSNNPVGIDTWGGVGGAYGNASNGDNQNGAGYTPQSFAPYKISSLGARGGFSQSFPYNPNAIYLDGGIKHNWPLTYNVNTGEEMDIGPGLAEPGSETPEEYIKQLISEMGTMGVPIKQET